MPDAMPVDLHPDATLLETCDRFRVFFRDLHAIRTDHPAGSAEEKACEAAMNAAFDREEMAAAVIDANPPTTIAGVKGLAGLLADWEGAPLQPGCPQNYSKARELCVMALIRGLTGPSLTAGPLPAVLADRATIDCAMLELLVLTDIMRSMAAADLGAAHPISGASVAYVADRLEAQRERIELAVQGRA